MIERALEIVNERGLHARAAAKFVSLVGSFQSMVTVSKDGNSVPGDSILGLMTLSASQGCVIAVSIDGPDEVAAAAAIASLVTCGFNED
jgi:phosphocarrier protein